MGGGRKPTVNGKLQLELPAVRGTVPLRNTGDGIATSFVPNNENGQNGTRGPYLKHGWQPVYLSELEKTHCVKAALDKAQISRRTYQRYNAGHPEFAAACHESRENAVDYVAAVVYMRCLHEDTVRRFDREGRDYFETIFPDALILRYLREHRPEIWNMVTSDTKPHTLPDITPSVLYLHTLES